MTVREKKQNTKKTKLVQDKRKKSYRLELF